MDSRKLALIASAIGVVVIGGTQVRVWQAAPTTTAAELRDAGVMDCPTRLVTCNWRIDVDGRNVLLDAGIDAPTGYRTLAARVKVCVDADGGRDVVFPPLPQRAGQLAALASPDLGNCTVDPDPGGALWRSAQSRCTRCPVGSTLAQCSLVDGGQPGALNAMPRAAMRGAAQEDTPCTVFAGEAP